MTFTKEGQQIISLLERREAIKENLAQYFYFSGGNSPRCSTKQSLQVADSILRYLDSQGVVLKTDIEIPEEGVWIQGNKWLTKTEADCLFRVATQRLMEY